MSACLPVRLYACTCASLHYAACLLMLIWPCSGSNIDKRSRGRFNVRLLKHAANRSEGKHCLLMRNMLKLGGKHTHRAPTACLSYPYPDEFFALCRAPAFPVRQPVGLATFRPHRSAPCSNSLFWAAQPQCHCVDITIIVCLP